MKDAEYLELLADVITTSFGASETTARLQGIAHSIQMRDLAIDQARQEAASRYTMAEVRAQYHLVDHSTLIANLDNALERAYEVMPSRDYSEVLNDLRDLHTGLLADLRLYEPAQPAGVCFCVGDCYPDEPCRTDTGSPCPNPACRPQCQGHEPGPNDPMGKSVYCDGTCQVAS